MAPLKIPVLMAWKSGGGNWSLAPPPPPTGILDIMWPSNQDTMECHQILKSENHITFGNSTRTRMFMKVSILRFFKLKAVHTPSVRRAHKIQDSTGSNDMFLPPSGRPGKWVYIMGVNIY